MVSYSIADTRSRQDDHDSSAETNSAIADKAYSTRKFEDFKVFLIALVGFLLVANVPVNLNNQLNIRASDLVAVTVLSLWCFGPLRIASSAGVLMIGIGIMTAPAAGLVHDMMSGNMEAVIFPGRLLIYLPAAAFLFWMIDTDRRLSAFLLGIFIGALVVATFAAAQKLGIVSNSNFLTPVGSEVIWAPDGSIRHSAIWEHPNELMQVQTVAACSVLAYRRTEKLSLLRMLAFLGIVALTYFATQTRAGVVIALAAIFLYMVTSRIGIIQWMVTYGIFCSLVLLFSFPEEILGPRWVGGDGSLSALDNISQRFRTAIGSLGISMTHPLGLGLDARRDAIYELTGSPASHNSFASLGIAYGIFWLLLVCVPIFIRLWQYAVQRPSSFSVFIPFLVALLMLSIEDSVFSPSMLFLALVLFFLSGLRTPQFSQSR